VHLARQVLEEAVELVEVAVRDRQERRRVGRLGALDRAQLDLQLVPEALDPPRDAHEVAPLEAAAEQVRVAEHAGRQGRRAVAQLERQVRRAGAGGQAVLARARVHARELIARAHGGERRGRWLDGGGHVSIMARAPDASRVVLR
jgi:hypothetical protein